MPTESKKLPIFDALVFPGRLVDCVRASDHARIVCEQREVIKQLVQALQLCQPSHPYETEGTCLRGQALTAAVPFLED